MSEPSAAIASKHRSLGTRETTQSLHRITSKVWRQCVSLVTVSASQLCLNLASEGQANKINLHKDFEIHFGKEADQRGHGAFRWLLRGLSSLIVNIRGGGSVDFRQEATPASFFNLTFRSTYFNSSNLLCKSFLLTVRDGDITRYGLPVPGQEVLSSTSNRNFLCSLLPVRLFSTSTTVIVSLLL
jgi:hypothetical protein